MGGGTKLVSCLTLYRGVFLLQTRLLRRLLRSTISVLPVGRIWVSGFGIAFSKSYALGFILACNLEILLKVHSLVVSHAVILRQRSSISLRFFFPILAEENLSHTSFSLFRTRALSIPTTYRTTVPLISLAFDNLVQSVKREIWIKSTDVIIIARMQQILRCWGLAANVVPGKKWRHSANSSASSRKLFCM